jgi:hypothetical protein
VHNFLLALARSLLQQLSANDTGFFINRSEVDKLFREVSVLSFLSFELHSLNLFTHELYIFGTEESGSDRRKAKSGISLPG